MDVAIQGPQEGALFPDFTLHFRDGRVFYRRELKGRSHAVIYFPPDLPPDEESPTVEALAERVPQWRAARAVVMVIVPDTGVPSPSFGVEPAADRDGTLRERFGVGPGGTLIVADRYGEIALRADGAVGASGTMRALPFDDVAPTLELLELRCSI